MSEPLLTAATVLLIATVAVLAVMLALRARMARDASRRSRRALEDAEAEARWASATLKAVMASVAEGVLVLDGDGRITIANRAAGDMHGCGSDDLVGKGLEDFVVAEDVPLLRDFDNRLAETGNGRLETRHEREDGTILEIEVRGSRLGQGQDLSRLVTLVDMSDKRRSEQRQVILSRKVLLAQEEERARLSRDLHDELGQILTALRLEMGVIRKKMLFAIGDPDSMFKDSFVLVEKAADELRRICKGLRPPLLDDLGVEPAVELLAQEFNERTSIALDLIIKVSEETKVSPEVALCIYRVLQEALTNVRRHSGARSASVSLVGGPSEMVLSVFDDGSGFDTDGASAQEGSGLQGMRERANLVGGSLELRSVRNQGTRVHLRVPLEHHETKEAP